MTISALLLGILLQASPSASHASPYAWEMNVDRPSLQVNHTADAVRGMKSDRTCLGARELYSRFGGAYGKNACTLAVEGADGHGYFSYCDPKTSYVVRIDLDSCALDEVTSLRDKRFTGTVAMDPERRRVFLSHLGGMVVHEAGKRAPVARYKGAALFSKHEFHADRSNLYLLDTIGRRPTLHHIDLESLSLTHLRLGYVTVIDYAAGRILVRSKRNPRNFGMYDVAKRRLLHRWQSPKGAKAHFLGDGWVAFWTRPRGEVRGKWILANAATGKSVYYGSWRGKRPPVMRWKGKVLYAGEKRLLTADAVEPIRSPLVLYDTRRAG